jgi:hypothetical protein
VSTNGAPSHGRSRHGSDCECVRCSGFPRNHALSVRHGSYVSPQRLTARAAEIASVIRAGVPAYSAADEVTIALLAQTLVRVERSAAAIDRVDEASSNELQPFIVGQAQELGRLRDDHARWIALARKLVSDLGLSPASRSALGLKLVTAQAIAGRPRRDDDQLDLSKLGTRERVELERLVEKATAKDDVVGA